VAAVGGRRAAGAAERGSRRSLLGWLFGFGSSILADQVFFLALTWAVIQVGSPGQVGLVLAAGSVPRLLILVVGGAIADRVSPKRIIIGTDSGRAVVMAAAAAVIMLGLMGIAGLVVVALVIGALDGLFLPAVGALPGRIAEQREMGRVAALRTVTQRSALLVGGPLAGWLILLAGPAAAFSASAGLFAVSVGCLALVTLRTDHASQKATDQPAASVEATPDRPVLGSISTRPLAKIAAPAAAVPRAGHTLWGTVRDGLISARRDPVLPWLLLLVAGMNLAFAGPVTAGFPLLAAHSNWGSVGAGLLIGGFGLGAAVSGLGLVFVPRIPKAGSVALAGVFTMGAALIAVATADTLTAAVTAAVILGSASGVFATVVHAIVLTRTPKTELGRVMALLSLSVEGVVPISLAVSGLLTATLGANATITIGGTVAIVTTVVVATRPALRTLQLTPPDR
jgi:MFS family permease